MTNPTSNFGWQMPTSTDLVTDLPADFEVFGQAVDTSLADLKGGTTGQVLKKNSNTDMDFVWSADSAGMTNPMTTTGDTIYSSSGSTPARLGIGTTGQVLTVSGGLPAWSTPAGGGKVLQVVTANYATQTSTTSSSYQDTGLTATITPSSSSSKIAVFVSLGQMRKDSGSNTTYIGARLVRASTTISQFLSQGLADFDSSTNLQMPGGAVNYLDEPATTSATTYKVTFANSGASGGAVYVQQGNTNSSMILMEIGA